MEPRTTDGDPLRRAALERIQRRRAFYSQLAGMAAVNVFMVVVWALSGAGLFWPGFIMAGSVVALAGRAWRTFGDRPPTEAEVAAEESRLRER